MSGRRSTRGSVPLRRQAGSGRGGSRIRRASAGLNRTRSLALLAMILSGHALYGANASSAFGYRRLDVVGAGITSQTIVRGELGVTDAANLFRMSTDGMADRLRALPTVADASIEIALPDTLRVRLVERKPILVWQIGPQRFLVDADRVAFAVADSPVDLPVIDDRRERSDAAAPPDARASDAPPPLATVDIGSVLDAVDFDAATRLASLRPVDVGSGAAGLHVTIDDDHGFTVDTGPAGWTATFGFYTPTIRKTDLIPGQVRLLRSLLAGQEASIATITLSDDLRGVFTPKTAP
jgi:hypothetical protein